MVQVRLGPLQTLGVYASAWADSGEWDRCYLGPNGLHHLLPLASSPSLTMVCQPLDLQMVGQSHVAWSCDTASVGVP
jgi:hypothetical protein